MNDQKHRFGGELIIGGCDVEADFYVPVSNPTHWQFHISSIQFIQRNEENNKKQNKGLLQRKQIMLTTCKGGCQALLDSGTGYICGPKDEITKINSYFRAQLHKGTQQYILWCNQKDLPTVVINIGGHELSLEPKDYLIRQGVSNQILNIHFQK